MHRKIESLIAKRLFFYLALLGFVIAEIPHLFYGFYWDESWSYGRAIGQMYQRGLSLLPDAMPPEYSRGHPLLFDAIIAGWMKVFGNSFFAMHCCSLLISVLLIVAMYEVVRKLFSKQAAIISCLFLFFNRMFFAQSAFVLSDIPLTLFIFLTLYYYTRGRYWMASFFIFCTIFTKESGAVLLPVLGIHTAVCFFRRQLSLRETITRTSALLVPCILLGLFFLLQKKMYGWYLFPSHISAIRTGLTDTLVGFHRALYDLLYYEYVYLLVVPVVTLSIAASIRQKKAKYLLIPMFFVWAYACILLFGEKDGIFYAFAFLVVATQIVLLSLSLREFNKEQSLFLKLASSFALLYLYFCSVNFYESRYLMPAIFIYVVVLNAILCGHLLPKAHPFTFPYTILLQGVAAICLLASPDGGEKLQFRRMEIQREFVQFMEKNHLYDRPICCFSYLEKTELEDYYCGFLSSARTFTRVNDSLFPETEYVVFDNMTPTDQANFDRVRNDSGFVQIWRSETMHSFIEVYKRR